MSAQYCVLRAVFWCGAARTPLIDVEVKGRVEESSLLRYNLETLQAG